VPAHEIARKPQHNARALECGGLPPPCTKQEGLHSSKAALGVSHNAA